MPLSKYLKYFPVQDATDQVLLFSTKKCSFAQVPKTILAAAENGTLPDKATEQLTQIGFLVDDCEKERQEVLTYLDQINQLNTRLRVSVILGMECNFACIYCYEGALKGKHAMNDATADQIVAYLKSRFGPDKKKMTLDFYGGEPLLYTKRIEYLARALQPWVEAQGAAFDFSLVTNGSLLTKKIVDRLKPLGLKSAKITIDGPADIHNTFRPFKSGEQSFAVIVKNIQEVCGDLRINLGGNFTRDNYHCFPELLDHLEESGLGPENLGVVKFDAVMQVNDTIASPEFRGGCASTDEPWLINASLMLREELLKRGYDFPKLQPAPCMVDVEDGFVVHYNGDIYKCVTLIGHEKYKTGDVWKGSGDYRQTYNLDHWKQEEKCTNCAYLPLCFGGCRYSEYQRSGTMENVDCQKEYFDAALEPMLLQDVRYRYKR